MCAAPPSFLPLPSVRPDFKEERGLVANALPSLAADLRSFVNVPQNSPMERFRIPPSFVSCKCSVFLSGSVFKWHPFQDLLLLLLLYLLNMASDEKDEESPCC